MNFMKVKKIINENDTEFKSNEVEDFHDKECIKYEFLAPYTSQ
jgi:hypothetical protein